MVPRDHWIEQWERRAIIVAKDFKEFIRISGMSHVRISRYYPQSNGKIERWHKTLKADAVRPAQPRRHATSWACFVDHYKRVRLHSAVGYVAPLDFMAGKAPGIWAGRDKKLEAARELRRQRRQQQVPA